MKAIRHPLGPALHGSDAFASPSQDRPRSSHPDHHGSRQVFVALLAGFVLATVVEGASDRTRETTDTPPADIGLSESFSEVEALKCALSRLENDHIRALRAESVSERRPPVTGEDRVLDRIQGLIGEFAGTAQAESMTQFLLSQLAARESWNRWIDVYLELAYTAPASLHVTAEIPRARRIANLVGREAELERALRHLAELPTSLPGLPMLHPARTAIRPTQ